MQEERPEAFVNSESNVLPFSSGKRIKLGFNSDVSGFFTARRTGFLFAGVRYFLFVKAFGTYDKVIS